MDIHSCKGTIFHCLAHMEVSAFAPLQLVHDLPKIAVRQHYTAVAALRPLSMNRETTSIVGRREEWTQPRSVSE